jgi:hypothetical protein
VQQDTLVPQELTERLDLPELMGKLVILGQLVLPVLWVKLDPKEKPGLLDLKEKPDLLVKMDQWVIQVIQAQLAKPVQLDKQVQLDLEELMEEQLILEQPDLLDILDLQDILVQKEKQEPMVLHRIRVLQEPLDPPDPTENWVILAPRGPMELHRIPVLLVILVRLVTPVILDI